MHSQLAQCRIGCTDSDTADTSPLGRAQDEKMQPSLVASGSVYHVVLDPSDYSKLIRLLFREPPEPDTLNIPMNDVVEPIGHF